MVLVHACALAQPAQAQPKPLPGATELAAEIHASELDPEECYRVRDLTFAKEDARFYLTEGLLIFSKPVNGQRLSAVFSANVEGGDAELVMLPPSRGERRSLASFAGTPNLDEHFGTAYFFLSGSHSEQLLSQARRYARVPAEEAAKVVAEFSTTAGKLSGAFETRLILDMLAPGLGAPLFFGGLATRRVGVFDMVYDPLAREQIVLGTPSGQPDGSFKIWTSFVARSFREKPADAKRSALTAGDFRIDLQIDPSLHLTGITRLSVTAKAEGIRAIPLQISNKMRVTGARLEGEPVEIFTSELGRAGTYQKTRDATFLVIAPVPLSPGRSYELEVSHEGDALIGAGNGVFYVDSRGNWYPRLDWGFSTYDVTFHYPKDLTLVAAGSVLEDRTDGDIRVVRRQTPKPVPMFGFNLGDYAEQSAKYAGYQIEVFANRNVEFALQSQRPSSAAPAESTRNVAAGIDRQAFPTPAPPDPTRGLSALAEEVGGALEYMSGLFGPPPLDTLNVSPIPGTFGQGFAGLLYLSTSAYLSKAERPIALQGAEAETFFSTILAPHETAHQWWGNLVGSRSYQDNWLMEALAQYSALLYLEKRKGAQAIEPVLDQFRTNLLAKTESGSTVESTGPITWGERLNAYPARDAWRTITYDKGAWIIHMLRVWMGDERFFAMLREMCRRYAYQVIATEDFRELVKEFRPPRTRAEVVENFFDTWVYDTGIPALKLTYTAKRLAAGTRLRATVTQTGVNDGFTCDVPVRIYFASGPPLVRWVRTSSGEPVTMWMDLKQPPVRVVLAAGTDVLAVAK